MSENVSGAVQAPPNLTERKLPEPVATCSQFDIHSVREIIAGGSRPQEIPSPKMVREYMERLLPKRESFPRWLVDDLNLASHYGGRAVACFQAAPSEPIAVLAVGEEEIGKLLRSLSDEEVGQIIVRYPAPWMDPSLQDGAAVN